MTTEVTIPVAEYLSRLSDEDKELAFELLLGEVIQLHGQDPTYIHLTKTDGTRLGMLIPEAKMDVVQRQHALEASLTKEDHEEIRRIANVKQAVSFKEFIMHLAS